MPGRVRRNYLLVLWVWRRPASVLTGAQSGLWQVAIVWGIAIMLAVYTVGAISGAHINPAITLAFAVWGRFSWRLVVPYVLAQLIGAFLAAATLFVLFNPYLKAREQEKQVVRGAPGSEITAMCYGEFFPSPGPLSNAAGRYSRRRSRANEFDGFGAGRIPCRASGNGWYWRWWSSRSQT